MSSRQGGVPTFVPAMVWLPVFAILVVTWPYLLGTWTAVELGAANPSTARSTAGWALQVLAMAAVALQWAARRTRSRRERDAAALADLESALACAKNLVRRMHAAPLGIDAQVPRPGKRLLFTFDECGLVEHRSSSRGAAPEPTVVAHGRVDISDAGLHFIGPDKIVTWPMRNIIEVRHTTDHVSLPLTSRKTISGVTVGRASHQTLALAISWANAVTLGVGTDDVLSRARELVGTLSAAHDMATAG